MTSARNNRLGIGLMCLGILMFALNDVMGKWLMSTYTVGQVLLLRSAAAMLILAPFALKEGLGSILRAPRPGLQTAASPSARWRPPASTGPSRRCPWSA